MVHIPILLTISKKLDCLPRFYHQFAHMIHKRLFLPKCQHWFSRKHQHVPIRIVAGIFSRP